MNIKEIKELIEIVDRSNLTGFEYENSGVRLALKKEIQIASAAHAVVAAPKVAIAAETNEPAQQASNVDKDLLEITSPIVGTFYAAPSPDAKSYASAGDKVSKGQTLCIVEAMKLMNEITAEYDCEIVKVAVKNEEVVQYGQPLFLVRAI